MKDEYKFLIIDDSPVDRLVATELLKTEYAEDNIFAVNTCEDAIAWLMENKNMLGRNLVILLDIRMPEKGGFDFLDAYDQLDQEIREAAFILMLSSTLDPNDINRARNHDDIKGLLGKPFHLNELKVYLESERN